MGYSSCNQGNQKNTQGNDELILKQTGITACHSNHIVKLDVQRLIKVNTMGVQPLLWCNDVLFWLGEFQPSEEVIANQIKGIMILDTILYAFSPLLDVAKWNGYSTEVLDMTGHTFFDELTEELKNIV